MPSLVSHDHPVDVAFQTPASARISLYNTQTVTKHILDQCLPLTLPDGMMAPAVQRAVDLGLDVPIYVLRKQNQIVAWAIVRGNEAMLFVDVRCRRLGYGSVLLQCCQHWMQENFDRDIMVCPHDKDSVAFFRQLPYQASPSFAYNMNAY